jgi:hypothetical protein
MVETPGHVPDEVALVVHGLTDAARDGDTPLVIQFGDGLSVVHDGLLPRTLVNPFLPLNNPSVPLRTTSVKRKIDGSPLDPMGYDGASIVVQIQYVVQTEPIISEATQYVDNVKYKKL